MATIIIRMEGIDKRFGAKVALEHADLELLEGEILGLVGDNGAGKSTLLKILSGSVRRDSGDIRMFDRKVFINSPRHSRELGIEMVYQDLSLCRSLSVWENIYLGRFLTHPFFRRILPILHKKEMSHQAFRYLQEIGIDLKNMNEPIRNLSGGEQQAVALCRCLLFRPKVILLDEPTASMAVWEKQKILRLILDLRGHGHSLIMVTHNLQDLFQVADRALVLKEGKRIWCDALEGMKPEDLAHLMFTGGKTNGVGVESSGSKA
jgi:ABC-type sugar transport system ATPase subunit